MPSLDQRFVQISCREKLDLFGYIILCGPSCKNYPTDEFTKINIVEIKRRWTFFWKLSTLLPTLSKVPVEGLSKVHCSAPFENFVSNIL